MTTRSKLEFYEDVLEALSHKQQTLDAIAFDGNMDCMLLRQKMDFLLENGLVEELQCKNKNLFALTSRGEAVLKTLTLTKRIAKLQAKIVAAAIEKEPVQAIQGEVWKTKRRM
jgi:predicted transcriptional regulator